MIRTGGCSRVWRWLCACSAMAGFATLCAVSRRRYRTGNNARGLDESQKTTVRARQRPSILGMTQQWEYKRILQNVGREDPWDEKLQELDGWMADKGLDGWELVSYLAFP